MEYKMKELKFEIKKISPKKGDFVMVRAPDKIFDKANADQLNQLAQDIEKSFPDVFFFFASKDYDLEKINKTQISELINKRSGIVDFQ
jgi:hypothetical protein